MDRTVKPGDDKKAWPAMTNSLAGRWQQKLGGAMTNSLAGR
jgi:hypothetical protein